MDFFCTSTPNSEKWIGCKILLQKTFKLFGLVIWWISDDRRLYNRLHAYKLRFMILEPTMIRWQIQIQNCNATFRIWFYCLLQSSAYFKAVQNFTLLMDPMERWIIYGPNNTYVVRYVVRYVVILNEDMDHMIRYGQYQIAYYLQTYIFHDETNHDGILWNSWKSWRRKNS